MRRREKNKALHQRLEEWGDREARPVRGLGYKSKTCEAEMMEMGQVVRSGNVATAIVPMFAINHRIAQVDRGIQAITDMRLVKVLESVYLHRHREMERYKYCQCKRRTFFKRLKDGEKFICAWIGYRWHE